MKYLCLGLISMLLTAGSISASTNAVGGLLIKNRNEFPNIIFLSIDDVGREKYQALNSPFKISSTSQAWDNGDEYRPLTTTETPGLTRLMSRGIDFEGLWSGPQCAPSRHMLAQGRRDSVFATLDTRKQIQLLSNNRYRVLSGGKAQLGGSSVSLTDNAQGPLSSTTPTCDGNPSVGQQDVSSHWAVGESNLNFIDAWEFSYSYFICDQIGAVPTQVVWQPGNATNDGYIYMDEAITDVALKFIKDDAFSGGDPTLLWDNHYAEPFIVAIGYHSHHGETISNLSNFNTDGQVQLDANIKAGSEYQARLAAGLGVRWTAPGATPELGIPDSPDSDHWWYMDCPGYPDGDQGASNGADGMLAWKINVSCGNSTVAFVDRQIVRFLDTLGEAGLRNTMFIFTGDNGTVGPDLGNRAQLNRGADDFLDSTIAAVLGVSPGACDGLNCGKSSLSETGLNVPFIVAGGVIPLANQGTSSKLRFNNTDVAETVIQAVVANASAYTFEGRNFTSVFDADCSAGNCDNLVGFEITLSQSARLGVAAGNGTSAVQEITNGKIYRVQRNCGLQDWVQELTSATPNADLRSSVGGADADLNSAYTALTNALTADGESAEGTAC